MYQQRTAAICVGKDLSVNLALNLEEPAKETVKLSESSNRRLLSTKLEHFEEESRSHVHHAKHSQPALRAEHGEVS